MVSLYVHKGTAFWLKINTILTFLYERDLVMFPRNFVSRDLTHKIIEPASQPATHPPRSCLTFVFYVEEVSFTFLSRQSVSERENSAWFRS